MRNLYWFIVVLITFLFGLVIGEYRGRSKVTEYNRSMTPIVSGVIIQHDPKMTTKIEGKVTGDSDIGMLWVFRVRDFEDARRMYDASRIATNTEYQRILNQ